MKISRNWLQRFFDAPLPESDALAHALIFHAFEVEEIVPVGDDTVLDVKVTPDRTHDALSHRGIAKELSVILDRPLKTDPLREALPTWPLTQELVVELSGESCRRYSALVIKGVKVGPSPQWLKLLLETIGQRSINNIVDATNYVMFNIGQPLHAFDADKLHATGGRRKIIVRPAADGEKIAALDTKEYVLAPSNLLIVDGVSDSPIGIAGVKGGKAAEVSADTVNLIIESANFDRTSVRKTSRQLKLRTDASQRYENEISPELTLYGLREVARVIQEVAGGEIEGVVDVYPAPQIAAPVSVDTRRIESLLGIQVSGDDVESIFKRFALTYHRQGDAFTVEPPFERLDISIPEDLVDDVGRIYGLENIEPVVPDKRKHASVNKRYYYSDKIRRALLQAGFSEIFTSSFRSKGDIELANAVAKDKPYLRKNLRDNLKDALDLNAHNAPLLGLSNVCIFEMGTVFTKGGEQYLLALGSRTVGGKAGAADAILTETLERLAEILGKPFSPEIKEGVAEIDLGAYIGDLPEPHEYEAPEVKQEGEVTYRAFSPYPFVLRDIALWVPVDADQPDVEQIIKESAGQLLVRLDCFDRFEKEGRVSYAFHLVFQSNEKTLSDDEVNALMQKVIPALENREGWKVR